MTTEEIATKQDIKQLEDKLIKVLLEQFALLVQELRLQNLKYSIGDEFLTKKQVMKLLKISANTVDKLEKKGKLIVVDWGDGKRRNPRYPKSQFIQSFAMAA